MSSRKVIRDNEYFLKRLEKEDPVTFADWKAGKYPSVRQALIASGITRERSQLHVLKNAWKKASTKEKTDFVNWIKAASWNRPPPRIVDADNRLLPDAITRINTLMDRLDLTMGGLMTSLGFSAHDQSVSRAFQRPTRIKPDVVRSLTKWLDRHKNI